jgi:hypothetical protein
MANTQSTRTLQNLSDSLTARGDLKSILTAGGYGNVLLCDIATEVFAAMCDTTHPWKWNEMQTPYVYLNSWQQDYAMIYPNGTSVTNMEWLTDGVGIQINNSSTPKPWSWIEVGRRQGRSTATILSNSFYAIPQFAVSWLPNSLLYYGTWGAAETGNATWGNNPQPNQIITPLLSTGNITPDNPILQIQDSNGNLLVLTTFGTTGATFTPAAANAAPGTTVADGSCVWTVVDPQGQGLRVKPVPAAQGPVWQLGMTAQMKPVIFNPNTSLNLQTLYPLTDDYYSQFKDGCIARCYMMSPEEKLYAKGARLWDQWTKSVSALSLQSAKQQGERERDLDKVIPETTVMNAGSPRVGWIGPAYPYGYPIS